MSTTVTNAFVQQYANDIKDEFQRAGSFLLNTVRVERNVVGSTHTFFRIGQGTATTKARHGTITPMNQTHTAIPCTLEDFYAGDWVDKLDENKLSVNERQALARGGAMALGRKVDDQLITDWDANSSYQATVAGALTQKELIEVVETLDANDVPRDGRRFGIMTPRQWSHMLGVDRFRSADFIAPADLPFLVGAQPRTFLGVHWMVHTGLPGLGTANAKGFAWHSDAVGYAQGQDITPDFTWHGDRAAHFVNNMMSGGACTIDPLGLVEFESQDTAAIPIT